MLKKVLDCMQTEQMLLYKSAMSGNEMNVVTIYLKQKQSLFLLQQATGV